MKPCSPRILAFLLLLVTGAARADEATVKIDVKQDDKIAPLFSGSAIQKSRIIENRIETSVELEVKVLQGSPEEFSFEIFGAGEVKAVFDSDRVMEVEDGVETRQPRLATPKGWGVRESDGRRFLDIRVDRDDAKLRHFVVSVLSEIGELPASHLLWNLGPGESVGFASEILFERPASLRVKTTEMRGHVPVGALWEKQGVMVLDQEMRFRSTSGGDLRFEIASAAGPFPDYEWENPRVHGTLQAPSEALHLIFEGTLVVRKPDLTVPLLAGHVGLIDLPEINGVSLDIADGRYVARIKEPGSYPFAILFAAGLKRDGDWTGVDFSIPSATILPVELVSMGEVEFASDDSLDMEESDEGYRGFAPASGRVALRWREGGQREDGTLFFSSESLIDLRVGAGLLRQESRIGIRILQGELPSLELTLVGEGEITAVEGAQVLSWERAGEKLRISFREPVKSDAIFVVRGQIALGEFPVTASPMRLTPDGSVRHAGYLRASNEGAVRLDVKNTSGLMQLGAGEYPGEAIESRQVFAFRFPSANYGLEIEATRIAPEVTVNEVVIHQLGESDRNLNASIELDIREAALREWEMEIPADYSVVSVTGAAIGDYVVGSEATDGRRVLRIVFSEEVAGRQLVDLVLEKNEAVAEGEWILPRLRHPAAKAVRGEVGVAAVAGLRVKAGTLDQIVERPLSSFPKKSDGLQLALRPREREWSATVTVERLPRSVEADVFHLYSLKDGTAYGSVVVNYFVTGSPVGEWRLSVPTDAGNIGIEGQDVRTWRREGDEIIVTLQQPVSGLYTLLLTCEEPVGDQGGEVKPGRVQPLGVRGERGYVQIVSPVQIKSNGLRASDDLLKLDALELPAEFRLSSPAPSLAVYQYTSRPFEIVMDVAWYEPGETVGQIVEFAEAHSRISRDGEVLTEVDYSVKTRGGRALRVKLPEGVKLWEMFVDGEAVNARKDGDFTLVPLPAEVGVKDVLDVRLRYGKATDDATRPRLALPAVEAPVLKTEWEVRGDERRALSRADGPGRNNGFDWLARNPGGIVAIACVIGAVLVGFLLEKKWRIVGVACLLGAIIFLLWLAERAWAHVPEGSSVLQVNVPVLSPGEPVDILVRNFEKGAFRPGVWPLLLALGGLSWLGWALMRRERFWHAFGGLLLAACGILFLPGGAGWFFLGIALAIAVIVIVKLKRWWPNPAAAATLLVFALLASVRTDAAVMRSLEQNWSVKDDRVLVEATGSLSGKPGESVTLLQGDVVLRHFAGDGLLLEKTTREDQPVYLLTISSPDGTDEVARRNLKFTYEIRRPESGVIPIPTGGALSNKVNVTTEGVASLEVGSQSAVKVERFREDSVQLVLLPTAGGEVTLRPRQRDPRSEDLLFYVESSHAYAPGPGLLEGRHHVLVRPARGVVRSLDITVPEGLAVSAVDGEVVADWRFAPDERVLRVELNKALSEPFAILVATQRSLGDLPLDLELRPLRVSGAERQLGTIGVGFRGDVQAERVEGDNVSEVNLADFDSRLFPREGTVLHRAYRYGGEDAVVRARIVPVEPEIRVTTNELLSLGEDRTLLKVDATASISRVGVFQLQFGLPAGFEVESLTSESMTHWTGGADNGVTVHFREQTTGEKVISLVLVKAGPAVEGEEGWVVPKVTVTNAARQTGELLVRPEEGLRLRTLGRRNVSEIDPRELARQAREGTALAFRLLQQDWELSLGIERLDPWVTGQFLHDVTLREGQTRHVLEGDLTIENASVRSLRISLAGLDEESANTLRASGAAVSGLTPVAGETGSWELGFRRRVIGKQRVRIEWERTGERADEKESFAPVDFPELRQISYYVALRAGAQLEVSTSTPGEGWYRVDWTGVPAELRGRAGAPVRVLRAGEGGLEVTVKRHALAESLKLRVAKGEITTVVSPLGDHLTAANLAMQVIQRDTLRVRLAPSANLFHVFVNGESVTVVRDREKSAGESGPQEYLFHVVPGPDGKTATVEFAYTTSHEKGRRLNLRSPGFSVPMENIEWRVVVPEGYELDDAEGDLELQEDEGQKFFGKDSYLAKVSSLQQEESDWARATSNRADALLQEGKQAEAVQLYQNLANNYNIDEATNEDARVKLERVQTDQVMAGLNTRRQRLYLDNRVEDAGGYRNDQLEQAATANGILQGEVNFRPDELGRILVGNTREENDVLRRIAARLVQHQKATEPAPQALSVPIPEEGRVFVFRRAVSVEKDEPLKLAMDLRQPGSSPLGPLVGAFLLVAALSGLLVAGARR